MKCPNKVCGEATPKGSLLCTACKCCYVYCDKHGRGFAPACAGICAQAILDIEDDLEAMSKTEGARQSQVRLYSDKRVAQMLFQRKVVGHSGPFAAFRQIWNRQFKNVRKWTKLPFDEYCRRARTGSHPLMCENCAVDWLDWLMKRYDSKTFERDR